MYKTVSAILLLLLSSGLWAQNKAPDTNTDTQQLRQQIEQMQHTIQTMEQRLNAQEKAVQVKVQAQQATEPAAQGEVSTTVLQKEVNDLDVRILKTETKALLDPLNWSGDLRTESNNIFGSIPAHYDGMQMQSLLVKTLWMLAPTTQGGLNYNGGYANAGATFGPFLAMNAPGCVAPNCAGSNALAGFLQSQFVSNYAAYQYFTNNLQFNQPNQIPSQALGTPVYLKNTIFNQLLPAFGASTPAQKQAVLNQLMAFMQQVPGVHQNGYGANANELATLRLRLGFRTKITDNTSATVRLAMYKVFGDSTNAQVFNGQPTSLDIDGTTARVPTGDFVRVERAYFNWSHLFGSPLYISIGRRPSTDGPPMNYRLDEPRGGTPMGSLINYQFDGVSVGYRMSEKMEAHLCWGLGFDSGFGNGQNNQLPADRVKNVNFLGGTADVYSTDKSLVEVLAARVWNVTDGFNGQVVLPSNPVTGDPINAPVILRFTPDANLGAIDLYGVVLEHRVGAFDLYASANWDSLRPNGMTSAFGGLGANPYDIPQNHEGHMIMAGVRYNVGKDDDRTKIGFEFNQGSKYWFNFAQAEDDIFAPKTQARGEVYETFVTHRINNHFIVKGDYQRFHYTYSGSGWDVGAPEKLSSNPILGFPTYNQGTLLTAGLQARF